MIYFGTEIATAHVAISDQYYDYAGSEMLVVCNYAKGRNSHIQIEHTDEFDGELACDCNLDRTELADAAIGLAGSSDNLNQLRVEAFYYRDGDGEFDYLCSTPAELFLHQHEIFMGKQTYGWQLFKVSIYHDHITFIMHNVDAGTDTESMILDISSENIMVELELLLHQDCKGFLKFLPKSCNTSLSSGNRLKLRIITTNKKEIMILAAYQQDDHYIPIIRIIMRNDDFMVIERLYPINCVTESILEQLLVYEDGYFCW